MKRQPKQFILWLISEVIILSAFIVIAVVTYRLGVDQ